MRILVNGMQGLGDNIYQRGFIKALSRQGHKVTVRTSWPQLYDDLDGIGFHKPHTSLRTQRKNVEGADPAYWGHQTQFDKVLNIHYASQKNIPNDLTLRFGIRPVWGLPKFKRDKKRKPYIVIRPVTVRKEWNSRARNPLPEYIDQAARILSKDFHIISVADLEPGKEWIVGDEPCSDEKYHGGELNFQELMGLCQGAAAIVGGVGWIVPFSVSNSTPCFIVSGGNGGQNRPDRLVNGTMDLSRMMFATPDDICPCIDQSHNCVKTINDLERKVHEWKSLL